MKKEENRKYTASFEIKEVTAFTLDEFIEKVKALTNADADAEISNIAAIVVTKTTSNP